jgi:hypothetical protein
MKRMKETNGIADVQVDGRPEQKREQRWEQRWEQR